MKVSFNFKKEDCQIIMTNIVSVVYMKGLQQFAFITKKGKYLFYEVKDIDTLIMEEK